MFRIKLTKAVTRNKLSSHTVTHTFYKQVSAPSSRRNCSSSDPERGQSEQSPGWSFSSPCQGESCTISAAVASLVGWRAGWNVSTRREGQKNRAWSTKSLHGDRNTRWQGLRSIVILNRWTRGWPAWNPSHLWSDLQPIPETNKHVHHEVYLYYRGAISSFLNSFYESQMHHRGKNIRRKSITLLRTH